MISYKKKMHRVMIEIFTIKFLTGDTILKLRTKVALGNKTEIQVFRNHILCPRILKLIDEINDSTPRPPDNSIPLTHFIRQLD